MKRFTADDIIRELDLERLPGEGGFFRRTWTSPRTTRRGGGREDGRSESRACGSAIYYLLTPGIDGFSAFHRLGVDEIYHFYRGDPVEVHLLHPDGSHERLVLGSRLEKGERPQAIVPAGVIQGSRLVAGGRYALLGTTMAPEFTPGDFTLVSREEIAPRYPNCAEIIESLTRG